MIAPSYRMVTLLEILETSAEAFWRLSSIVGQFFVRLEQPITEKAVHAGFGSLGELMREAERLDLRSAVRQLQRIKDEGLSGDPWQPKLRAMLLDLHTRILDDLEDRFFLSVPSEYIELYRQGAEPPFGVSVAEKFPQMSEDISEAGKCLALNRTTACVFHLMRAVEIAVQKFGAKIGEVALPESKNWQNILDEINKAIRGMDQKAIETKRYAAIASHLYNVKLAWRNEVMHPKQTYTFEEAKVLFDAVGSFIGDLSTVV